MSSKSNNSVPGLSKLSALILENKTQIMKKCHEFLKLEQDYGGDFDSQACHPGEFLCSLDFVTTFLNNQCAIEKVDLTPFLEKIRLPHFNISDLYIEFSCLQLSIEAFVFKAAMTEKQDIDTLHGFCTFRKYMNQLFLKIIQHTALFFELSIKKGITGFCQIDTKGDIIYANQTLTRFYGADTLEGYSFDSLFAGNEKLEVADAIKNHRNNGKMIQKLECITRDHKKIPVGVELSGVFLGGEKIGSYAKITDLTEPISMQNKIFDESPMGIVRVDRKQCISYTNQNFRDLLGLDCKKWKGMKFESLLPPGNKKYLSILKAHHKLRVEGKSSEYDIKLRRIDDGRDIPVKISSSPEINLTGDVVGALGIVRSLVRDNMLQAIEQKKTPEKLLKAVARVLKEAIPYDRFQLALFSRDKKHARQLFTYSAQKEMKMDKRWYQMTPAMIEWASQKKVRAVKDVNSFYNKPEFSHLKQDGAIQQILMYYKSFIYYPVFKKSSVIACLVLYSKSKKPYGSSHKRLLQYLPLESAVLTAIHQERIEHLEFKLSLLDKIASLGDDLDKIAHCITKRIAGQYKWENVSIFSVNRNEEQFKILSQNATSKSMEIDRDHCQPIDSGFLGMTCRENKSVKIDDVRDEKWASIYVKTLGQTRSELCIPIRSGYLFWILNIEESIVNAFSREEQGLLEDLVQEIGVFLERAWLRCFMIKSLDETSDAVFQTNLKGTITTVNRSALQLLGQDTRNKQAAKQLVGKDFRTIVADSQTAEQIISASKFPNRPVAFIQKSGKTVNALVSKFRLHKAFSTNMIMAKDLTSQERLEELQYLKKIYSEIAFQTKTPITLVSVWLKKIREMAVTEREKEYAEKAGRQLRRLEVSFDRLALYDNDQDTGMDFPPNTMLVDMNEIKQKLKENIPEGEFDRIDFDTQTDNPYLNADLFQICFCFETIFSYLFRSVSDEKDIKVTFSRRKEHLLITISGRVPDTLQGQGPVEQQKELSELDAFSKTMMNMALGEPIIKQFIENNQGRYHGRTVENNTTSFSFDLPLGKEPDHG